MNDDPKLRDFARRVCTRQIRQVGDTAEPVEPKAVYVRVSVGTSRRNSSTVGRVDDCDQRDAGEVVETIREILSGNDGEEPRGYLTAYRVGDSNPFDSVIVALGDGEEKATAVVKGGGDLSVAMQVIERMARNADSRADQADYRMQRANDQVLGFLERAMAAEREGAEIALMAELDGNREDRMTVALRELGPLIKVAAARMMGVRRPPQLGKKDPPKEPEPPKEPPKAPEAPPPTPGAEVAEEVDVDVEEVEVEVVDTAAEAKATAMQAVEILQELYAAHPELAKDTDLVEGMSPLVLAALDEFLPTSKS